MILYKYTPADYWLAAIHGRRLKVATVKDSNNQNEWLTRMRDPDTEFDWNADPKFRGQAF